MITTLPKLKSYDRVQVDIPGIDHAVYMRLEPANIMLEKADETPLFDINGDDDMLLLALNLLNVTIITDRTITKLDRHTPVRITSPNTLGMPIFMLTTGNKTAIFTNGLVAIDEIIGGDDAVIKQLRKLGYEYA